MIGLLPADTWITLPDGRRLAARLWRPVTDLPAPAVLEYLPYRKRDGTAPRDATTHPVFAAAGYACIRVDVAGTGDSDGLFDDEYSEQELSDGEAVIAWIARQPWCDGNVGMIGISWGGFNGLQLAVRRPPALKAVVTCCSTVDRHAEEIDPAAPGRPAAFPVQAAETLREPSNRTERRIDPDGTRILETFDDFGASRDLEHGLETGSHVTQRYSIHPDDPLSARHEARWRYELRRGDRSVRIDSKSVMASDADTFHLSREVTAREGDTIAIARRWDEDVPRGLS